MKKNIKVHCCHQSYLWDSFAGRARYIVKSLNSSHFPYQIKPSEWIIICTLPPMSDATLDHRIWTTADRTALSSVAGVLTSGGGLFKQAAASPNKVQTKLTNYPKTALTLGGEIRNQRKTKLLRRKFSPRKLPRLFIKL